MEVFTLAQELVAEIGVRQPGQVVKVIPSVMETSVPQYSALIRTLNGGALLKDVVHQLRNQTRPPAEIIAVDSGSTPEELATLRQLADRVVDVSDREFNYARSLNAGVQAIQTELVLIISAHVRLEDPHTVESLLKEMAQFHCEIGYLVDNRYRALPEGHPHHEWFAHAVGQAQFDGGNGVSNSCALLPRALPASRPFREEVFSAEDQEWTAWYLQTSQRPILRVETSRVRYLNPRVNYTKLLNEELAIACFVDPRRKSWPNIGKWLLRAAWSSVKQDRTKAMFRLETAKALWHARSHPPSRSSKYF
jgi:glycosyltransferase involved in cell wall biosynthesis